MKKLVCVLLAALLLLAGCGTDKQQGGRENVEQPAPLGTWKAGVDLSELINEQLYGVEELDIYLLISEFMIDVEMTFREDGTYSISVDETTLRQAADALTVVAEEQLLQNLEEELLGIQQELMGDDTEGTYQEITMEQMLAQSGTTMEKLQQELQDLLGTEILIEDIMEKTNREGTYKVEEGKLYMAEDMQTEIDNNAYEVYTVEGDVLTLVEQYGNEEDVANIYLYPLEFQKIG